MACDQHCRSHRVIPNGTAVSGSYHGHAFTGVVLSHRGGIHWCLPEYRVQVDVPFAFMGDAADLRSEVRIDINDTLPRRGLVSRTQLRVIPPPLPPARRVRTYAVYLEGVNIARDLSETEAEALVRRSACTDCRTFRNGSMADCCYLVEV